MRWWWENYLNQALLAKPAEIVHEACQVMEKHGCRVYKDQNSELYYSSTLSQVPFQVLHYLNLRSGWSYRNRVVISLVLLN